MSKHEEIACQINLCASAHAQAIWVSEMIQPLGPKVIAFAMKELGITTQGAFARKCKLSRSYVSRMAAGKCECSVEFAARMSGIIASAWEERKSAGSAVAK